MSSPPFSAANLGDVTQQSALMLTTRKIATVFGVKLPTIRYYWLTGKLPEARRSSGNQQLYRSAAMDRIRFARELGLSLEAICDPLSLPRQARAVLCSCGSHYKMPGWPT